MLKYRVGHFLNIPGLVVGLLTLSSNALQAGTITTTTPTTTFTGPKITVGIVPAEDRWVTLTDGSKVYQGVEISYLLGDRLFSSGQFEPSFVSAPTTSAATVQTADRMAQIPPEWTQWVQTQAASNAVLGGLSAVAPTTTQSPVAVTITPVVETLLYASGAHSDRLVFGFSPDHQNPFNQGRAGALDNEFIATTQQLQTCTTPDFFGGQFNPTGSGPSQSNFGANLDQGVSFNILGFGFGFKQIKFEVHSQIRFLVDDHVAGTHQELVFQTVGTGNDVMVAGSYDGFNLGLEIQRRQTLVQALKQMLPQIVNDLIAHGFSATWQSSVISTTDGIVMGAGTSEGVQVGMQVGSPFGAIYQVASVSDGISVLTKVSGATTPFVGEPLRLYTGQPLNWSSTTNTPAAVSTLVAKTGNQQTYASQVTVPMDQTTRAATQSTAIQGCSSTKPGWFTSLLDDLFTLYAWWRYDNVFDQNLKSLPKQTVLAANSSAPRIALIDSGIDYNDSNIRDHVALDGANKIIGFDFISWDTRPSDDNGHGSASARLMVKSITQPFTIVPLKAIGSHGETHSSAIYDAFNFAVANKVDAIVVPWSSATPTLTAYKMGAQLASAANIPVFVAPNTVPASGSIVIPTTVGTSTYKATSLSGAPVTVGPAGVAAITELARWMNSKTTGGPK